MRHSIHRKLDACARITRSKNNVKSLYNTIALRLTNSRKLGPLRAPTERARAIDADTSVAMSARANGARIVRVRDREREGCESMMYIWVRD